MQFGVLGMFLGGEVNVDHYLKVRETESMALQRPMCRLNRDVVVTVPLFCQLSIMDLSQLFGIPMDEDYELQPGVTPPSCVATCPSVSLSFFLRR